MKNFLSFLIALCLLAGCSFLAYQYGYEQGSAAKDTAIINRSPQVIYPSDQYIWEKEPVYVYWATNDKHYHESPVCSFAIKARNGFIQISDYEAVERGYSPCINCTYDEIRIGK